MVTGLAAGTPASGVARRLGAKVPDPPGERATRLRHAVQVRRGAQRGYDLCNTPIPG